jgi:hypothetical protein
MSRKGVTVRVCVMCMFILFFVICFSFSSPYIYVLLYAYIYVLQYYLQSFYVHVRPVSPGTVQQIMPTLYTNGSLDTLTITCLTATMIKAFMFPMLGFIFAYVLNILIVVILCD